MSVDCRGFAEDTLRIAELCFQFQVTESTPDTLLEFQLLPKYDELSDLNEVIEIECCHRDFDAELVCFEDDGWR